MAKSRKKGTVPFFKQPKKGTVPAGQVPSRGRDTGGAPSLSALPDCSGKGADIGAAQLIQFIGTGLGGQTLGGANGVPVAKCLRSRDTLLRHDHYAPDRLKVRQWQDLLPSILAQNRSADEEQRHIGADFSRNLHPSRSPARWFVDLLARYP